MAKKASSAESNREHEEQNDKISIIKLRLTPEQARRIRIAAAIRGEQPGSFCRSAAIEAAEKVIAEGLG